ncbi:MAG: leucine-rich repeat protein [Bacteroidaceae bacterium]|nr:leucine-rich repeat protein [Bacteroidaceae bacterium]
MKRFIYCALIALIAVSCNDTDDLWGNASYPVIIPKTFYAQTPVPGKAKSAPTRSAALDCTPESWGPATRTYAVVDPENSSEYFQYWTEGDAISLFFTTANLQYQMQSYKNGTQDIGIFELVGDAAQGTKFTTGNYYSVYPYKASTTILKTGLVTYQFPDLQHYNGDSYANGENAMIAVEPIEGTDSVLYFQNFCSYLQLRMIADAGQTKTVKKITLTSNVNTNPLAGEGSVNTKSGVPVVAMKRSATNRITLDCGSGVELSQDENNPSKFWFVLPADITFSEGFTVTAIFDDYSYFKRSTSKEIHIARSHIKPMATFKPSMEQAQGPIRYKYNDTSIDVPYPLKNTFFGEDGKALDIVDQIFDETTGEWVVLLSGTLKTIGDNSFENTNYDIEYIKIDNDDKPVTINNFAFYNCTADSLMISNDIENINESAFTGSTIKDLKIDGSVSTIKNSAGTGSHIENIIITGDVETIAEEAFHGCEELKTIDIAGNVTVIENQAFSNCKGLETLNVGNIETIGYRAFYMCTGLTEANIPGVKHLEMGAFRDCINLETITLDSVITIDDNAFMDCSSLTTVVISEYCTMIGEGAFCNATSLADVYCYAEYPPFIKTDNYNSSYVFDTVHEGLCIYIPNGSTDYYLDPTYFIGNEYAPPVEAEVNWWYEEYYLFLCEMEAGTQTEPDEAEVETE